MNKQIKKFINQELPGTDSERLEKCLTWFVQNHREAAIIFKLLAKEGKDTMQIYRTLKAEGALIGFTAEIEKHKTLLAAIEWCVRRHTQDKLESN